MRSPHRVLSFIVILIIVSTCLPSLAIVENESYKPGQEDLSKLTYEQILKLQSDISAAYKANHSPTDAQKKLVLMATQNATQQYYSEKRIEISGWAWYDNEYTYSKDWDFYTLKTHLDYKDINKKNKKAIIYAELFDQDGKFTVAYLNVDNEIVVDVRSDYGDVLWFTKPTALINKETQIDLSLYTARELSALNDRALKEIEKNHSVSKNEASIVLTLTKSDLEQYCIKNNIEIQSYAWYDSEYTYLRDWDYYWLETHVNYKTSSSSSQIKDTLYSEVCKINDNYELIYLKMGEAIITDRKKEIKNSSVNGIPNYNWVESDMAKEDDKTNRADSSIPKDGIFNISLTELSDEQLAEAAEAIRAEQKARIKTHISIDTTEMVLTVGKNQKIKITVVGLPSGEKKPKLKWSTSNKNIATYEDGKIVAVGSGTAVITFGATLSDGTYISEECKVRVIIPISSITVEQNSIYLDGGKKYKPTYSFKPGNASIKALSFESSNPEIASVSDDGTIEGNKTGNAIITAKAIDGSGKSVAINVKVVDNRISREKLLRILKVATGNYGSLDVYTNDGMFYDKTKLHDYTYFDSILRIIDDGFWTTNDDGNTWHVENFLLEHKKYGGFLQFSFDIMFDGKNYVLCNGWVVTSSKRKWLDKSDPSKYDQADLSNLDFNIFLIVSPKQIGE